MVLADAAVYWMARMIEAGEDPIYVLRRMVIFAGEDVGNADPQALPLAMAALDAVRLVGMPEGFLPLTQAVTYLACAPKSNTAMTTYLAARKAIEEEGTLAVPAHLRNATNMMARRLGHGRDYKYPHDHADHHVDEAYLPEKLLGHRFYRLSTQGAEQQIGERLARLRGENK